MLEWNFSKLVAYAWMGNSHKGVERIEPKIGKQLLEYIVKGNSHKGVERENKLVQLIRIVKE